MTFDRDITSAPAPLQVQPLADTLSAMSAEDLAEMFAGAADAFAGPLLPISAPDWGHSPRAALASTESAPSVLASERGVPADTSITAGTSRQDKLRGGMDWLDAAVYGHWDKELFEKLKLRLEAAQQFAREDDDEKSEFELIEGDWIRTRPSGAKKGQYFKWIATTRSGVTIYVKDKAELDDRYPNLFVTIGSLPFIVADHRQVWQEVLELLASIGFTVQRAVPSRADLALDCPGVETDLVVRHILAGGCIRRAKKVRPFMEGYTWTGIAIGRNIMCRIYDKTLEVSSDPVKLEAMRVHRWGGVVPEHSTRVEFQLRREPLRQRWQVESVEDLFRKLPFIITELCVDWLRITEKAITAEDRHHKNHARYETSTWWKEVLAGFLEWMGEPTEPIILHKIKRPNTKQTRRQALGCLQKIAALQGRALKSIKDVTQFVVEQVASEYAEFCEGVERKRRDLLYEAPSKLLIVESMIPF